MNPNIYTRQDEERDLYLVDARQGMLRVFERAHQIARTPNLEDLIAQMLDLMIEVHQAESGSFYLYDAQTDELVITTVRGDDESLGLVGLRMKRSLGIVGAAIDESQAVIVGDLPGDPRWMRFIDPERAQQLRNAITMPLFVDQRLLGAVQIFNYAHADLGILRLLGDRLGYEIDHRVRLEELGSSNRRLNALIDILGQVAGTMDRDRLLCLVTEHAARLVDAERSSIHLVEKGTDDLAFQVSYRSINDRDQDDPSTSQLMDLFRIAISGLKPGPQTGATGPLREFGFSTRSALSVPLVTNDFEKRPESDDRASVVGGLMALNKRGGNFNRDDREVLQILADQTSTFLQIVDLYENNNTLFLDVLKALVTAIDAKDPYTQGHSLSVSEVSVAIADELGLDQETINNIRIGSLLHDVGKIGIPDSILKKPGKLTDAEYEIIKTHASIGDDIMKNVRVLHPVLPAISQHHERLDGSGYPHQLRGDQITLEGRIVAVADVFDAMTSDRPYRDAIDRGEVLAYLVENAGSLFDQRCVGALVRVIRREQTVVEEQAETHA